MILYDTCSLLNLQDEVFTRAASTGTIALISDTTLRELEEIKSSGRKTELTRYQARHVINLLWEHQTDGIYEIVNVPPEVYDHYAPITGPNLSNDMRIMIAAAYKGATLATDDIACGLLASNLFHIDVIHATYENSLNGYTGYKEIALTTDEISEFYSNENYKTNNKFDLIENQYLIIREFSDTHDESLCNFTDYPIVATYKWTKGELKHVANKNIKSIMFGDKLKPKDIYQTCAIDSILNNTMTALSGKAGSGKSLISLMTIMHLIDSGAYDRVVVMFNPTKARGASDMGFYSGNALDKALQNSIGEILTSKFGDRSAVDILIQQGKLRLVSMADIRGMEVRDNEIIYITECQNTTADLLKLCITRASSSCKIVIEGDFDSQVDSHMYEGNANGMRRAIEVLRGDPSFGYVQLPNIWRSKIAELASKF